MNDKRQSFFERLSALPEVFTNNTGMRLLDLDEDTFKSYMYRWSKEGYVQASGPKTGVYFNLIANPQAPKTHAITALQLTYPTAILRGESVLNAAGWTTQIPRLPSIAVLNNRKTASVDGFNITPKPKSWLIKIHPHRIHPQKAEFSTFGLPALPPAFALADLWSDKKSNDWKPDPDDLCLEDEQWVEVANAFQTLGVEIPEIYKEFIPTVYTQKKQKKMR